MMPKRINKPWITLPIDTRRTYFNLCIIKFFLDEISPDNDMADKLLNLFLDFPDIDLKAMGFPDGWESEPLWRHNL